MRMMVSDDSRAAYNDPPRADVIAPPRRLSGFFRCPPTRQSRRRNKRRIPHRRTAFLRRKSGDCGHPACAIARIINAPDRPVRPHVGSLSGTAQEES
jgi:hypothetical protein